ncbi:polysaccharide deacetylase family protein [Candidatus Saccharibacteria bacterium]|nr:polysaccharide deacetylase family protein [Candidatus Saccharibacteria bacterium]
MTIKRWTNHLSGLAPLIVALFVTTGLTVSTFAAAAIVNPTPSAKISFTFDDGLQSSYTNVAPLLQKHGLTATNYVITGCVGKTTIPNTCHANNDAKYMTWAQIKALQNTYGWEIGSHTATHPYLATKDASDGQPNVLTTAQVNTELATSKNALLAHGLDAKAFSTPYGDYNPAVLAQIAQYYENQRGFADNANNNWPYNEYLLYDMPVQVGVTVAQVKARIDQAIANNQWLILTMHDVKPSPSKNPDDYQYGTTQLENIATYVQAKQAAGLIKSVNVSDGLVKSTANLLPNSTFNNGIADGWTTDSPSNIIKVANNKGSYPDAVNSIRFVSPANGAVGHLFSPLVPVNATQTYMLKTFLSLQQISTGNVGFYIDEYDASGNWISGQYKKAEGSVWVENLNFTYQPTSPAVAQARYQFIMNGTGIRGFLDNVQWFVTQTSTQTTLLANGEFNAGINAGWSTDSPVGILADHAGNGNPVDTVAAADSIHLTSSSIDTHLFAPKVAVSSPTSYDIYSYVDVRSIQSGEVGFYIDEYDASGNWISGQYKTGVRSVSKGEVGFSYTPSSSTVSSASLQVIVVGGSGINAYYDSARWFAAN